MILTTPSNKPIEVGANLKPAASEANQTGLQLDIQSHLPQAGGAVSPRTLKNRVLEQINTVEEFDARVKGTPFESISKSAHFSALQAKYGLGAILQAISQLGEKTGFKNPCKDQLKIIAVIQEVLEGHLGDAVTTKDLLQLYSPGFASLDKEKKNSIFEFLRRVNKYEFVDSMIQMNRLPPLQAGELSALKTRDWSHEIFGDENLELYALREFVSGNLDVDDLSEILVHDECTKWDANSASTKTIPFFNDGIRNEESIQLLKESTKHFCTDADIETFLADPEVQKGQMYLFPMTPGGISPFNFDAHIMLTVAFSQPFLFFPDIDYVDCFRTQKFEKQDQIVLSPKLLQKLFSLKYGNQAPRINPVLGNSLKLENFEDASKRDAIVPSSHLFPESQLRKADGRPCSPTQAYGHDLFHSHTECWNPHRAAYNELAKLIAKNPSENYHRMQVQLLDKDFQNYVEGLDPYRAFKDNLMNVSGAGGTGISETMDILDIMLSHIERNQDRWKNDYGIIYPKTMHTKLKNLMEKRSTMNAAQMMNEFSLIKLDSLPTTIPAKKSN